MLFQPARDGAHEVLAAGCLAFPVVGFAAGGGVVGVDVVGGFLEDDFGHGWSGLVDGMGGWYGYGGSDGERVVFGLWVVVVWGKGKKKERRNDCR